MLRRRDIAGPAPRKSRANSFAAIRAPAAGESGRLQAVRERSRTGCHQPASGEGGIRTPERGQPPLRDFQSRPFNRSGTSPFGRASVARGATRKPRLPDGAGHRDHRVRSPVRRFDARTCAKSRGWSPEPPIWGDQRAFFESDAICRVTIRHEREVIRAPGCSEAGTSTEGRSPTWLIRDLHVLKGWPRGLGLVSARPVPDQRPVLAGAVRTAHPSSRPHTRQASPMNRRAGSTSCTKVRRPLPFRHPTS